MGFAPAPLAPNACHQPGGERELKLPPSLPPAVGRVAWLDAALCGYAMASLLSFTFEPKRCLSIVLRRWVMASFRSPRFGTGWNIDFCRNM